MKKIKIFLASSIVEFANERMEIENFIRNISDKFEDNYNIKLQPLLCENFDDAYSIVRKQEEYNEKIRESEFCFFIFFTRVGEFTREEFDVAREQFEKTGKPKIYTYFKIVEEGQAEQSVYDFMNQLDKTFSHYYGTFSHIDTIKLRILLSLKMQEMDFVEIKLESGDCVIDGKRVMSIENVSEFAHNENLEKLQKELSELEKEYFELKPLYDKGSNDEEFYKRYSLIASRRQYLKDEIDELQKLIFTVSVRMIKDDAHGTISERQKSAYRLFEKGDYEGCMSVLDSNDIDSDFHRDMARLEGQKITLCRKYIKEHKTAIDILCSMKNYEKRFEEIEERYKKIIPYILELKIETDIAIDYASYLNDQGKDSMALPIIEKLIEICCDEADLAEVYNLSGIIYNNINKISKAEEYYLKATAIREQLAKENPNRYNADLAMSYNNAGVFYDEQGQINKAEEYYLKAIAIYEKLACENPERYNADLAVSYNNAGIFYSDQGQAGKAEEYYLKAIAIGEQLAKENPNRYNADLAMSYNNAGVFYDEQGQINKAEEYLLKAIAIIEQLAKENPEHYNSYLATSYNNAGVFYTEQDKINKAEEYYLKAIAIREQLVRENPERYNPDLAVSYLNYGFLTKDINMLQKALELAKTRPDHPICRQIIDML